jgi:hypothetical protein
LYGADVSQEGSSAWQNFKDNYWAAQQGELDPRCVIKPKRAEQISATVLIARLSQCPFAVKSGGHTAFAGAASIEDGITISFENMKEIKLAADKKTVSIQPGNRWQPVYEALNPKGVSVIGSREGGVGTGGFTMGGGIGFQSSIYGWGCDNVVEYELITASGIILKVNAKSYPDLYWALRGGGNNFGIVSKFTINTFSQGLMWGGARIYLENSFPELIDAFVKLGFDATEDPNAGEILSFGADASTSPFLRVSQALLSYAKPEATAPIFSDWNAIQPTLIDTTFVREHRNFTSGFAQAEDGFRQEKWTHTLLLTEEAVQLVTDSFYNTLGQIIDVEGLLPAVSHQPVTVGMLKAMQRNGGNPLGLSPASGPLLLVEFAYQWNNVADDARIRAVRDQVIADVERKAKAAGVFVPFLSSNYAAAVQDVIGSYPEANQDRLKRVAAKYDPTGVWQRLWPGYFKLDGPPQ